MIIILFAHAHVMNVNESKLFYHYFEQTRDENDTLRILRVGTDEHECMFDIHAPYNVKMFTDQEYHTCFIENAMDGHKGEKIVNISILHSNLTTLQKAQHTTMLNPNFITDGTLFL